MTDWKKAGRWLAYLLFSLLGIWLFRRTFADFDFAALLPELGKAHLPWLSTLVLSVCCAYSVRAWRWKLLLEANGRRISFIHCLSALMCGYLVNIGLPRGGELARCFCLDSMAAVPHEESLGTVLIERVIDLCMLILLTVGSVLLYRELLIGLLSSQFKMAVEALARLPFGTLIPLAAIVFVLLLLLLLFLFRRTERFVELVRGFGRGLGSIGRLKQKWSFTAMTLAIWLMYFYHTYSLFLIFPMFDGMNASDALVIQASGSIAKLVPVFGNGAGAYHSLVSASIEQLGHPPRLAASLSLVNHGIQLLLAFALGLIGCLVFLRLQLVPKEAADASAS